MYLSQIAWWYADGRMCGQQQGQLAAAAAPRIRVTQLHKQAGNQVHCQQLGARASAAAADPSKS